MGIPSWTQIFTFFQTHLVSKKPVHYYSFLGRVYKYQERRGDWEEVMAWVRELVGNRTELLELANLVS